MFDAPARKKTLGLVLMPRGNYAFGVVRPGYREIKEKGCKRNKKMASCALFQAEVFK